MILSERITEGYMYSYFPEYDTELADIIRDLAKLLHEKHPDFKFNTCWVNSYEQRKDTYFMLGHTDIEGLDNIRVEFELNILKNHYWFVWVKENEHG